MKQKAKHVGQTAIWLLSLQTLSHTLVHIVSLFPIILGVATNHHSHHTHHTHLGESIMLSIILNMILHGGMAYIVAKHQGKELNSLHTSNLCNHQHKLF